MPGGIAAAIVTILMPFVLRKQGVTVDRIAEVVATASIPYVWYFVYSPVVDLGLRRRTWVLLSSVTAALCCAGATLLAARSVALTTVLLFVGSALAGISSTANGALLSALAPDYRGRASGFLQAGNLGGGAVGGGVAIWLAGAVSLPLLALGTMALVVAPSLAALLIRESAHEAPESHSAGGVFGPLVHDLRDLFRSSRLWIGLAFFLSPVGSAAVANLISSVGPDYRAPDSEVLWVTGIAGGLLSAAGAFLGGYICDRMSRRAAYSLAGGLSAVCSLYMALARPTAFTFGAGYSAYSVTSGFAYAVFTALVLEVLGSGRRAAGTGYSMLVASGNFPIIYMTWLDGIGYKHWGARGLMGVDSLGNGAGAVLLLLFTWLTRNVWHRTDQDVLPDLPAA
jgi:MFS transporter, PAT family, beta-lactamase induction signal transducer AmpG